MRRARRAQCSGAVHVGLVVAFGRESCRYLHECKLCHPLTGEQAGLPPTLLSLRPFEHATVQLARIAVSRTGDDQFVLELTATDHMALLPCVGRRLAAALATTTRKYALQFAGRRPYNGLNGGMVERKTTDTAAEAKSIDMPTVDEATTDDDDQCADLPVDVHYEDGGFCW